MVLFHGTGDSAATWDGVAWPDTWRVVALDLRGHGASPWPGRYHLPVMAEGVLLTLDGSEWTGSTWSGTTPHASTAIRSAGTYVPATLPLRSASPARTGWMNNAGADTGIVTSLPGQPRPHYIVSVFSNLGDQYIDPSRPADPPGITPVEHTQKLAQLGQAIDRHMTARRASTP